MAGGAVLVAALAALFAAGCKDDRVGGCAGAAVIVTLTPSPAGGTDGGADADADTSTDGGGGDARPTCTGGCDEYLEALRVAIEGAAQAACVRYSRKTVLACTPNWTSPGNCPTDTQDANAALEGQIRDYLGASWPEIPSSAVSLDTCTCHIN